MKTFNLFFDACALILIGTILSLPISVQAEEQASCSAKEYRQFDFWIGHWEVKDHKNTIVGTNKIFPIMNGCALSENWTGAGGNNGVSYNFYDQAEKEWHQTWIDQSGNPLYLNGQFENGAMVLSGYRPGKNGGPILHRIIWTPIEDGRVKQHWQRSTNKGKSWSDVFIGFYSKK